MVQESRGENGDRKFGGSFKKVLQKRASMWLGFGLSGMVPITCVLLRERETGEPEKHSLTLSVHLRSVGCLLCQAIQGAGVQSRSRISPQKVLCLSRRKG